MQNLATDCPDLSANDYVMAKTMADTLHKHYPGHLWAVTCERGLATVRNLALSGDWGFVLKVGDIYSGSSFDKDVIRAGGEILERYRVSRGLYNPEQMAELSTDFSGRTLADMG